MRCDVASITVCFCIQIMWFLSYILDVPHIVPLTTDSAEPKQVTEPCRTVEPRESRTKGMYISHVILLA